MTLPHIKVRAGGQALGKVECDESRGYHNADADLIREVICRVGPPSKPENARDTA